MSINYIGAYAIKITVYPSWDAATAADCIVYASLRYDFRRNSQKCSHQIDLKYEPS